MFGDDSFYKVMKKDVLAYGAEEATLLAFIAEFEARNMKCWVSRRYIAKRVGMSEASVQRKIDKLIELGAVTKSAMDGRRCLETVADRWERYSFVAEKSVALASESVSN